MRTKLTIVLFVLITGTLTRLNGQDVHFSQYFNSPLGLNPAQTGNFEGNWRAAAIYRNQWQALDVPFKTVSASFDKAFIIDNQKVGAGLYIINDQTEMLKVNKLYASGAYFSTISNFNLSGGLQIGFVLKKTDPYSLPSHYDYSNYTFSPGLPGESLSYLDINLGGRVSRKVTIFEPEMGLSVYHLNHPKESFNSADERLPLKFVFDVAMRTAIGQNSFARPRVLVTNMRGAKDIVLGSELGYNFMGNRFKVQEIRAGIFSRNGVTTNIDALVFMFGAQIKNLSVNVSYDRNVSVLKTYTNGRGAFELSIIFRDISAIFKSFTIPCERI